MFKITSNFDMDMCTKNIKVFGNVNIIFDCLCHIYYVKKRYNPVLYNYLTRGC